MGFCPHQLVIDTIFFTMITKEYNPSPLEVRFAEILCELKDEINKKLEIFDVFRIESNTEIDNPTIDFFIRDNDGDEHEVVLKIIQKPE